MLVIGIIFLVLYSFFMLSLVSFIMDVSKKFDLLIKRQDEIIRILKK